MYNRLAEDGFLKIFRQCTTAELKLAWNDRVTSGLVKPEHAKAHIEAAKRIINIKRHVLGFPEFPC